MTHEELIAAGFQQIQPMRGPMQSLYCYNPDPPNESDNFNLTYRPSGYDEDTDEGFYLEFDLYGCNIYIQISDLNLPPEKAIFIARQIHAATQSYPAVSEFLGFAEDECGNVLLVNGRIVDEDDDNEAPESIEIGRSEEFNKLLAAAKAEMGGVS